MLCHLFSYCFPPPLSSPSSHRLVDYWKSTRYHIPDLKSNFVSSQINALIKSHLLLVKRWYVHSGSPRFTITALPLLCFAFIPSSCLTVEHTSTVFMCLFIDSISICFSLTGSCQNIWKNVHLRFPQLDFEDVFPYLLNQQSKTQGIQLTALRL